MEMEATVRELAPRLLRFCLGRLGARDLAEEAAQEALSALVARWRRLGPPESPEAFAFAVARRRGTRVALRRRLTAPLAALRNGHEADRAADPETRALRRAELERTLTAMRRLSFREREALLLVAAGEQSVGCTWHFEDGVLAVEPVPGSAPEAGAGADPLEESIDLVLRDADLREVLEAFGQIAGIAVEIAPEVKGRVTEEINDTPAREVLDRLCDVNHCTWEVVEGEGGPVLRVRPE